MYTKFSVLLVVLEVVVPFSGTTFTKETHNFLPSFRIGGPMSEIGRNKGCWIYREVEELHAYNVGTPTKTFPILKPFFFLLKCCRNPHYEFVVNKYIVQYAGEHYFHFIVFKMDRVISGKPLF